MSRTNPVLVLVHGAWHGPDVWDRLAAQLSEFDVVRVALPSAGPDTSALGGLDDDSAAVSAAISSVDPERDVVVVAHSYGGVPVTAAVDQPNVRGIVFVAAWIVDVGQSLVDVAGGPDNVPDWWDVHPEGGYVDALRGAEVFYNDMEAADAASHVETLTHNSLAVGFQPLERAAWRTTPSTYVVCDRDASLPPAFQLEMAGSLPRVLHLDSGHSPFLSRPSELADIVRDEARIFAEGIRTD
ncbi:MAG: alpha/beta hydrolase [Actinomycetales bacterium]|nr:MAG: alpha/beta hydrolase [Actinomycetales bacterium]